MKYGSGTWISSENAFYDDTMCFSQIRLYLTFHGGFRGSPFCGRNGELTGTIRTSQIVSGCTKEELSINDMTN